MLIATAIVRPDSARPERPGAFAGHGRRLRDAARRPAYASWPFVSLRRAVQCALRAHRDMDAFAGGPPPLVQAQTAGNAGGAAP